jgi:hypothetical protein
MFLTFCFCLGFIMILEVDGRDSNTFRPSPPSSSASFHAIKEKNSSQTQTQISKFP